MAFLSAPDGPWLWSGVTNLGAPNIFLPILNDRFLLILTRNLNCLLANLFVQ